MKSFAVICVIVLSTRDLTALADGLSDEKKMELAIAAGKSFADEQLKQATEAAGKLEKNLALVRHGVVNPRMAANSDPNWKELLDPPAIRPSQRAEAKPQAKSTVYFESDSERSKAIKEFSEKLAAAKKRVDDLKSGAIFDCPLIDKSIFAGPLQVGSIGLLRQQAIKAKQVLNANEALVARLSDVISSTINPNTGGGNVVETGEGDPFLLRGISTAGWADGKELPMRQPIIFTGTYSYTSAAGAKRTVLLAEPLDWNAVKRERLKADSKKPAQ
jgi:hypothetical protein